MSVSLYRKYRPQTFHDLIGQKAAVSVLTSSIVKNKVGHAYLFSGSRGCGKTSAARIFAKALNCTDRENYEPCGKCRNCLEITAGESLDVIEIDGASNNGVDNIRGLRENVALSPFNSRYKIYIIDEVHMLTQGAFNALLKTLEEPPEHVIFIMATTEPHKVPVTIRSRCQHIPFKSITPDDIFSRLEYVCNSEGITYEADALREISRQADGALRDALSLLEQVSAAGDVTLSATESVFGAGSRPAFERWITGLRESPEGAYPALKAIFEAGASPVRAFEELFALLRDLLLVAKWGNVAGDLGLSSQEREYLVSEAEKWKADDIHRLMNTVLKLLTEARLGVRTDILLGMFIFYTTSENTPVKREISTPHFTPPPAPQIHPEPAPVKTEYDPSLKADLLRISHEKNFNVWCALFDSRPILRGKDLVLDMAHMYCYTVMRIDKNAVELTDMFPNYSNVILRYGMAEYICPRRPETIIPPQAPPQKVQTPSAENHPEPVNEPSPQPQKPQASEFGSLMYGLRSMGLRPEVIMLKHGEKSENDSDNDNDETEGENDE